MALTSSLFAGVSGMTALGNSMQIIGDNLANVNTVGFKGSTFQFQDMLSQTVATQAGLDQIGRGTMTQTIATTFDQGTFENTSNSTDLAIAGNGFFVVRETNSENVYYTRAGNFHFNSEGNLVGPNDYVVQGRKLDLDAKDIGGITDIALASFTVPPKETTKATLVTNLNADATSRSDNLSNSWNADNLVTIADSKYDYQSSLKVYDSLGSTHDLTIYYDKSADEDTWEYMICCNPEEDKRNLTMGTSGAGILARGTLNFNKDGEIEGLTMEKLRGRVGNVSVGSNTAFSPDNVTFKVNDTNYVDSTGTAGGDLTQDYGFELTYDETAGEWTISQYPPNGLYANATVITDQSDATNISINLGNPAQDASFVDLSVKLGSSPNNGATLRFDLNSAEDIHLQDVPKSKLKYSWDELANESQLLINNPNAITHDAGTSLLTYNPTVNPPWTISGDVLNHYTPTVTGDDEIVHIDLEGDGTTDISFDFTNSLTSLPTTNTDGTYTIEFELNGTTAWQSVTTPNDNGYFEFKADFLGDEYRINNPTVEETAVTIEFDPGAVMSGNEFIPDNITTTQFARANNTMYQSQNGYGVGDLIDINVDANGVIRGIYSNGQTIPHYRVTLASFVNNHGLFKNGGNLFSETSETGPAIIGIAGTNGLGSINSSALEQSNIDVASEFVNMIVTQRGFQANSKIVTSVDTMLAEVIAMKK